MWSYSKRMNLGLRAELQRRHAAEGPRLPRPAQRCRQRLLRAARGAKGILTVYCDDVTGQRNDISKQMRLHVHL